MLEQVDTALDQRIPGCVQKGDVFSPLVVAGQVAFTVSLSGLDESLDSAADFETLCSVIPGDQLPSAFGAKFQGTATNGEGSCFAGAPGDCRTVPTSDRTWGGVKALFE